MRDGTDLLPFETIGEARGGAVVILADHAHNHVPPSVGGGALGLPEAEMRRHIAYDIGIDGLSRRLGELMGAPVVQARFSRLVIDPNRGEDDPTLVMKLYDGTIIPANRYADAAEVERRLALFWRPYHEEVARLIAARERPVIVSLHSFTPRLKARAPRPWHVAVLSNDDRRLSDPLLARLRAERDLCVGDNEPYGGALKGDTLDRQARAHGHLHTLIEVRQDLIAEPAGQAAWAERLAPLLRDAISEAQEKELTHG